MTTIDYSLSRGTQIILQPVSQLAYIEQSQPRAVQGLQSIKSGRQGIYKKTLSFLSLYSGQIASTCSFSAMTSATIQPSSAGCRVRVRAVRSVPHFVQEHSSTREGFQALLDYIQSGFCTDHLLFTTGTTTNAATIRAGVVNPFISNALICFLVLPQEVKDHLSYKKKNIYCLHISIILYQLALRPFSVSPGQMFLFHVKDVQKTVHYF